MRPRGLGIASKATLVVVLLAVLGIGVTYAATRAGSGGAPSSQGSGGPKGPPIKQPATPVITSGPVDPTNHTGATFTYTDSSSVSFLCSLDNSAYTGCGSGTTGTKAYGGPLADGRHTFAVKGQSVNGTSTAATWTWTVDTDTPPSPVITEHPPPITNDKNAHFKFTDTEDGTFSCKFDAGTFYTCKSPENFNNTSPGNHTFCVKLTDPAGNTSDTTCWSWTFQASFSMTGTGAGLLYPGGPVVYVNLVFSNPNSSPVTVTNVTTSITGTSKPSCGTSNFTVAQQFVPPVTVPANSTRSLSQLGVPQSRWPQLRMIDTGTNQDACKNADVNLSFAWTTQ